MITPDKIELGAFPTAITSLENISKEIGRGRLYLKRDDLTGLGGGGNKLRKLEYLAAEAKARGYTVLLTVGGPQTNHGRMTAAAAARLNMKSVILVTGETPDKVTANILLDALFESDFRILNIDETVLTTEQYFAELNKAAEKITAEYESKGEKVYYIPLGGSSPLGAMGYFFAVKEIIDQCREGRIQIDHLVSSFGSGGTFAGLWMGAKYFKAPFDVTGVTVSPGLEGKKERLMKLMAEMNELYDLNIDLSRAAPDVFDEYNGDGYNVPDKATREAVRYLASREGLLIDPVYTGKGFRGTIDLMRKGHFGTGNVLFLHSGGVPALNAPRHLEGFQSDLGSRFIKTVEL